MDKIFGYDWEDIQRAQQGGRLNRTIPAGAPLNKPQATDGDLELLKEHGLDGLKEKQLFGVIDRLQNSGVVGNEEVNSTSFLDCFDAVNQYGDAIREFERLEGPVTEEQREKVSQAKLHLLQSIHNIIKYNK